MRNQLHNSIFSDDDTGGDALIDVPADVRFRSLAILFVVGAFVVLGRIAWVQAKLQDRYLEALNTTTTEYEVIPARDGRILSEASDVFATDIDQYSIQVHYRWLQDPIDPAWLQRQVRNRLNRSERRNEAAVLRVEEALNQQRRDMWAAVVVAAGLTPEAFEEKRAAVQQKVQRIADSVNQRRMEAETQTEEASSESVGVLFRFASAIRLAVTTTPRRRIQERVVVREEESFHELVADVPLSVAATIREQSHLYPGVRVIAGNRRTYPLNNVAPHIVGARTAAKDEDATSLPENVELDSWTPRLGRFGVELSYNHQLQSIPGLRRIVRNRRMEIVESEIERQPVGGRDLVLTLDVDLQQHVEHLLAETLLDEPANLLPLEEADENAESTEAAREPQPVPTGGSVVVIDVTTGRLVAAASAPSFHLSLFTGGTTEEWGRVNADLRHPFLSRITSMAVPPGSIMKPLSALALMESGYLNPDDPFMCQGYLTRPNEHRCLIYRLYNQGHNEITLKRAIAQSCNVYFFSAALKSGFSPLKLWCDRFGLGRETGIDVPFEQQGNVPGSSSVTAETERRFQREALGLAIGQSSLTVTPVQMARAMAAIANGGWLVTPHVVSPDGTARTIGEIDDRPRKLSRRRITGLSEATLERVQESLRAVVEEQYGTGYKTVRLDDVAIAGKTGTAETAPGKPDHAWFAGYVPADDPQYAFAVVFEHGGSGSRVAGPVARETVRKMLQLGLLETR
ncbi:MAG: penicillin-binding transpeptidase domain-containing protein [Fuerstiella sp.]